MTFFLMMLPMLLLFALFFVDVWLVPFLKKNGRGQAEPSRKT
jgi:hypothetical protein